ncbi:DNA polymerase III subunit epsilon [Gammaproteobacteria bacterium]
MNWLSCILGERPHLTPEQTQRLLTWRKLPAADLGQPMEKSRYVVVDVETSGLSVNKDRLIAIGAVAVIGGRIHLGESLGIVLRQVHVSNKDNILIHGIGGEAQREGMQPAEALLAFLEYLGHDPLIAFHALFDEIMINRAIKTYLDMRFNHSWLDLAYIAPALFPRLAQKNQNLDQWMAQYGINNYSRHNAVADAVATAELLIALRPALSAKAIKNFNNLRDLERMQRMSAFHY